MLNFVSGEVFLFESIMFFGGVWKNNLIFVSSRKLFEIFVDFSDLCDKFEGWVHDFYRSENLAMNGCDVDCTVIRF